MVRLLRFTILLGCLLSAQGLFAATYYVDYVGGSDSNNGTTKLTPWQNSPGMLTCASVCASTVINAGDQIIHKGGTGETWPNASFQWSTKAGSTGNPVYYGVDKTWFNGGSWTRPVLNPGGTAIPNNFGTLIYFGHDVTIDNFEITGYYWNSATIAGNPYGAGTIINWGQQTGQTLENCYIHGWTHAGTNSATNNQVIDINATGGGGNSVAHDNIIVGTDVPGDHSANAFFNGPPIGYNNYIKQVSSGAILSYSTSWHDNHIEDVGPAYCNVPTSGLCTHENGWEDNGDRGLTFYNNTIANVSGGLAIYIAPNPAYTATLWNNVIYNIHGSNVIDMGGPIYVASLCPSGSLGNGLCKNSGRFILYNNTIECGDDTTLYDQCNGGIGASESAPTSIIFKNNHSISLTSARSCSNVPLSCSIDASNIVQTLAVANGQGYKSSQAFAFSPTATGNSTVAKGIALNLSSGGDLATSASDTTYACALVSANQLSCPRRTPVSRASGWDAGAYQFGTSLANPAPIDLKTLVH
jgi:hypothetical protein